MFRNKTNTIMVALLAALLSVSGSRLSSPDTSAPNTRANDSASYILPTTDADPSQLPDFSTILSASTKKQRFFDFMLPMIRHMNDKILADRGLLLSFRDDLRSGTPIDSNASNFIGGLAKRYGVGPEGNLLTQTKALLTRVDVVPASLVLAQSATESGWGTSRFAREANNLFGVWCFTSGCGLVPRFRSQGLRHEVVRYDSLQASVGAYIHTINSHAAYKQLREIRARTRQGEQQSMSGLELAEGLLRYSTRGLNYVREVQQLIRINNLQQYTLPLRT